MNLPPPLRRPALLASIFFGAGILLARHLPPFLLLPAAAAALVLFLLPLLRPARTLSGPPSPAIQGLIVAAVFLAGAARMLDARAREAAPPGGIDGARALLVGVVAEQPSRAGSRLRFAVAAESVVTAAGRFPLRTRVMASIPAGYSTPAGGLEYGTRIRLAGRAQLPSEARNPGEFSQKLYYEANGITLLFRSGARDSLAAEAPGDGWWVMRTLVLPVRAHLLAVVDSTTPGEAGGFLKGIMLGDRSGLSPETKESFAVSGVAHVLAVSGSNVAVIAAIAFGCLSLFRVPRRLQFPAVVLVLLLYMLMTGSQPPVVRATVMAIVLGLGHRSGRSGNGENALGVAALAILAADPRQLMDVGFQLSFAAVFALIHTAPFVERWIASAVGGRRWGPTFAPLLRLVAASAAATLGTLPITAMAFGRISVVGLLANIVVVPAAGLSLVLGTVTAAAGLVSMAAAKAFAAVNGWLLWASLATAHEAARLPFASVDLFGLRAVDGLAFASAVLAMLHLRDRAVNGPLILSFLILLNLALLLPPDPATASRPGTVRIAFLAVARGEATVVEVPGGPVFLAGAGGRMGTYDDAGAVVLPYLRRRGIDRLDAFLVDPRRPGAATGLLAGIAVRETLAAGADSIGPSRTLGPVRLRFLRPTDDPGTPPEAMLVSFGAGTVLVVFRGPAAAGLPLESSPAPILPAAIRADRSWMREDAAVQLCALPSVRLVVSGRREGCPCTHGGAEGENGDHVCAALAEDGAVILELDGKRVERILWR